jgi:hypothetical protein
MQRGVWHIGFQISWGYVKRVEIVSDDRSSGWTAFELSERPGVDMGDAMSQQSRVAGGAALSVRLEAQAVLQRTGRPGMPARRAGGGGADRTWWTRWFGAGR